MRRPPLRMLGLLLAMGLAGCDATEPTPVAPPVAIEPAATPTPARKGRVPAAPVEASPSINQAVD